MLESLGEAAAADGVILLYVSLGGSGALGATPAALPVLSTLEKQLRFWGFNLYAHGADPQWLQRGLEYVPSRLESGALKVVIAKSFPLAQYADAHRYLESNQQIGRVVVTV